MKINAISRSENHSRDSSLDIFKVYKNPSPALHPFERAREYTRALNSTKLERLFSKPFINSLSGHVDGIYALAKHPHSLTTIASASADGCIKQWSLSALECTWTAVAHKGFINGLTYSTTDSAKLISVGADKCVKIWNPSSSEKDPVSVFLTRNALTGVDHHQSEQIFATSSNQIDIWNYDRSEPINSYTWGSETILSVKFNKTEKNILASCGSDRTITLYDIRSNSPISKVVMQMRTNAIAWNPMEAFNFSTASEDHNIYTFDMRNLHKSINIGKDHVSAVLDLDYSPTGQELVSGSYDKTIRIFNSRDGKSREIYHTKRMQKIFQAKFTMDAKFVLSASDDGNIRIWKANASAKLGALTVREKNAIQYSNALQDRFKHMPEIKRIAKQRKVPNAIKSASSRKRIMLNSITRKEENERKHSAPGSKPYKAERNKHIVAVDK